MDYASEFVDQFCNQLAINEKGLQRMMAWYVFEDKRPETVTENFEADAKRFWDYEKMFRP
jgi:hypothetical protein